MKDVEDLHALNLEIGKAENAGPARRMWFEELLAPVFVIRRASGAMEDRLAFLGNLKAGGDRETTIEDIDLTGSRAVVHTTVTAGGKRYDNVRVFVRGGALGWWLLAWANEELLAG